MYWRTLFRASSLTDGLHMFKKIITDASFSSLFDGSLLGLGMDRNDFEITAISLMIVLSVSLLKERHLSVRTILADQRLPVRWAVYYALILYIILFGAYGDGYIPVDPIYADF